MGKRTICNALFILAAVFFVVACSVSKRHYRKGYHVEWLAGRESAKIKPAVSASPSAKINKVSVPEKEVIRNQYEPVGPALTQMNLKAAPVYTDGTCDVMIFKAGEEIEVKVVEVLSNSVKYKYCERLDGPTYETLKKDIFMVKYANGTREVFDAAKSNSSDDNKPTINNGPVINSQPAGAQTAHHQKSRGDRSWVVALILCILVGVLGVHRFYLGDYTMGVLYLSTFGLCFIGVIVDIILLATNNLEPEEGYFTDGPYKAE